MASGLATRCPACGTVFRVVLDQLRVSEGWVRCGRCSDVFNAGQTLLDLESGETRRLFIDAPADASGPAPRTAPPLAPPAAPPPAAAAGVQDTIFEPEDPSVAGHADPPIESAFDDSDEQPAGAPVSPAPSAAEPAGPAAVEMPSFVRRAERAQRWRRPQVRAALGGLAAVSALVLVVQVAYAYRDLIAARVPAAQAGLVFACEALGCSVGPPRAIEQISVESSGLVRVEKSSLYRLGVALRNRGSFDVALPAVEVTVSDAQGKLLARRVLRPAEMGASQPTLGAGRDLSLQATLQIATEPVAGYSVEIFYP